MTPTRTAALKCLEAFLPRAGAKYASHRNFDHGPADRSNISMLSPYIRHRLVTEEEVTKRVLEQHSPRAAEKFLQEIAWRTYWKGWLEMRPTVWSDYRQDLFNLPKDQPYQQAIEGRTGLECFDAWAKELIEHGYLHNHTRMWFASIWIFTLKLPWQLGADFFMRHLMDADPASNTLSWRWVAGLHTPGKHYLARATNIEKYTLGRHNPAGELDETAAAIPPDRAYNRETLGLPEIPKLEGRVGHLVTADDLSAPPCSLGPVASSAILQTSCPNRGNPAEQFINGAILACQQRFEAQLLAGDPNQSVTKWIARENLDHVICVRPTVGPWLDLIRSVDTPIYFFVRSWDRNLWPRATSGFFKLRKALPSLYQEIAEGPQLKLL